jgi:hypothetical protein
MKTKTERIIAVLQASLREGAIVEAKLKQDDAYWLHSNPIWDFDLFNYRVSLPCGGKREPITAAAWEGQAVVWVRLKHSPATHFPVGPINGTYFSVQTSTTPTEMSWSRTSELDQYEYSFDRVKWHPFVREVESGWQVVASTEEGV